MTTEFKMPDPIYQMQIMPQGRWIDHSKEMHELAKKETVAPLRIVYTESDMRAVIEQCAKLAAGSSANVYREADKDAIYASSSAIRKLLEQVK